MSQGQGGSCAKGKQKDKINKLEKTSVTHNLHSKPSWTSDAKHGGETAIYSLTNDSGA